MPCLRWIPAPALMALVALTLCPNSGFSAEDDLAQVKQQRDVLEKQLAACRLTIAKQDEEIKALREVNQALSNTLEITRQALENARNTAEPAAKAPF